MSCKAHDKQQNATPQRAKAIWEDAFLRMLSRQGNITAACRTAKIYRSTAYRHRDNDPVFAALWDEALEEACDRLEKEAWRRATKGIRKGVYYQGREIAIEREYSDTLLLALLKANRPDKFRDRVQSEISGPKGQPIQAVNANVAVDLGITDEEILRLAEAAMSLVKPKT